MADRNELARILAEEYGITSMKELDEAIRNMEGIDITPFCGRIGKEDGECQKEAKKNGKREEEKIFCRYYY